MEHRLVSTLLEIEANPARLHSVFFADIHQISQFQEEMEVLFSLGSTFRITSIDFDDDNTYWIVRLDATDDGSDRIHQYCQSANYDLLSTSPMIYFGRILNDNLDQVDRAVRYFRELSKSVETTHPELAEIYDALGDAYSRRKEINRAIKYYKIERKIQRQRGTVPSKPDQKIHESLRMRLEQEEKKTSEPNLVKAGLLCELGNASKYAQAEIYFSQALHVYDQLQFASSSTSTCMKDLAWAYAMNHKYQQCVDLHYRRLAIEEEYLPADNQQLCETLKDIMDDGRTPDDDRRFVEFCHRKLLVLREKLNDDHSRLIHMRRCLVKVQDKLDCFEEKKAEWIEALQTIDPEDLHRCSQVYHDVSEFYFRYWLFNDSIQYKLNELETCQNIHGYDQQEIVNILKSLALCYDRTSDYSQAFVYMEKAFRLSQSIELINPKNIVQIQNKIDSLVRRAVKHQIELSWTLLTIAEEDSPW